MRVLKDEDSDGCLVNDICFHIDCAPDIDEGYTDTTVYVDLNEKHICAKCGKEITFYKIYR